MKTRDLPEDLHLLAFTALCTPLLDAETSLNVLSDEIQTRGLAVPYWGKNGRDRRTPLEKAWEWARAAFWRKPIREAGSFEVEVENVLVRHDRRGRWMFVIEFTRIDTNTRHFFLDRESPQEYGGPADQIDLWARQLYPSVPRTLVVREHKTRWGESWFSYRA